MPTNLNNLAIHVDVIDATETQSEIQKRERKGKKEEEEEEEKKDDYE